MRILMMVVYTALALGANGPAFAESAAALRDGDMKKLAFHAVPVAVPDLPIHDATDKALSLADWRGQWVVLNLWATWCAPCRHEMPSLDRLQAAMPDLAVLPVATGRNSVTGIEKFYAEAGVAHLPILRDPTSDLAHAMGVMGLPVTVIIDPQGRAVAQLIGDAEWDSPHAKAVLAALMAGN